MMVAGFLYHNLTHEVDLRKPVIESDERYRILTNAERAGLPSFEVERLAVLLDLRHRSQENNLGLNFSPRDEALLTRVLALPNEPQEHAEGSKMENLAYDAAPPKSFRLG